MKKNRYKLLITCLIIGVIIVGLLFGFMNRAVSASKGFSDVGENDWFFKGVEFVSENRILEGVTETTFEPNSGIDRTTLVEALFNYSKIKGYDVSVGLDTNILSYDDAFDIREGAYEAFQWACGSGLMPDEGAASLKPNETISREQMVMLLYDYALLYDISPTASEDTNILSYTDVFDIRNDKAYGAFQWACGTGIIDGTTDSTLRPSDSATRAEFATMLMRLSEKKQGQ